MPGLITQANWAGIQAERWQLLQMSVSANSFRWPRILNPIFPNTSRLISPRFPEAIPDARRSISRERQVSADGSTVRNSALVPCPVKYVTITVDLVIPAKAGTPKGSPPGNPGVGGRLGALHQKHLDLVLGVTSAREFGSCCWSWFRTVALSMWFWVMSYSAF